MKDTKNINDIFSERLREVMIKRGYVHNGNPHQTAFANKYEEVFKSPIDRSTISKYISGNILPPSDKLKDFAQLLSVSTDYLLGISDRLEYEEIQTISNYIGLSETSITNIHDFYTLENKQNPLDIILSSELGYIFLEELADFLKKRNYFNEEFTTKDNDKILIDLTDYRTIKLCAITNTLENIEMIVNNSRSVMSDFYQKKIEELKEGEQNGGNKKKKE